MQDVARQAAVSTATVSRVLNTPNLVRPETRQRVESAMQALDYRINNAAQLLRTQQSHRIAAVVDQLSDPISSLILEACAEPLTQQGYSLELCITQGQPQNIRACVDKITQQRGYVDRVLWLGTSNAEAFERLQSQDIPVLLANQNSASPRFDYEMAAYVATNYLIQAGHRRIALLTTSCQNNPSAEQRRKGYERALRAIGLPYYPHLVYEVSQNSPPQWEQAGENLLDLLARPSAFLVYDDLVAAQLYRACALRGLRVPEDASIIGCGDLAIAPYLYPALTSLRLPLAEFGQAAAQHLLSLPASDAEQRENPPQILSPQLIVRNSVALVK